MSIIQNIHFGLSAWAGSTLYSVGNRVSNIGNAYQCVQNGTSGLSGTGGPTGGAANITDNTVIWKFLSPIDFTSPQAWNNAWPGNILDNMIGWVWNNGPITTALGTAFLTTAGHNMGGFYALLTPALGEGFKDKLLRGQKPLAANANAGVCFTLPSGIGNVNYFNITDSNIILDGLQFIDPFATSGSTILIYNVNSTGGSVRDCIFDGYAQAGGAVLLDIQENIFIRNTLVVDRQPVTNTGDIPAIRTFTNATLTNLLLIAVNNPSSDWFESHGANTGGVVIENTAVFGYSGSLSSAALATNITASNSAFSFPIGNITNFTNKQGNLFSVNPANCVLNSNTNFLLKSTSPLLGGGVNSANVANNDITGNPRKQSGKNVDIGPSDYIRTQLDSETFRFFII